MSIFFEELTDFTVHDSASVLFICIFSTLK